MNSAPKKSSKQYRSYLDEESAARLEKLAESTGQSEAWLATLLVQESLKALEQNGYTLPLPLKLQVGGPVSKVETPRPKRTAA